MEDTGEGTKEGGFAEAGDALQKDMAAGEHADEHAVDGILLSYDDLTDFLADLV